MKIQKINTGIIITKTAKQPSAKIEFSLDELDALSEFCERLQDEKDIREYLNTAVTIPDSAEVSAPIAAKYLRDAAHLEKLVSEPLPTLRYGLRRGLQRWVLPESTL